MSKRRAPSRPAPACPCGLPASYRECCGRMHSGRERAVTAERLMRSRFSAFAVRDAGYLLESWHPVTRPARIDFEPGLRWERLEILATEGGGAGDAEGTVEFRAHFDLAGKPGELHEVSRFVRSGPAWVYLNGTVG